MQRRRPARARRPHAGLRLRLRARRGRPGRAARRSRRTPAPTGSTRRPSRPCCGWRTTSSASPAGLLDAPGHRRRRRSPRAAPSRAARRAGRPRRATRTSSARAWCCRRPRTPPSTRPRTTSASRPVLVPVGDGLPGRPGGDGGRHRRPDTVLVVASAPSYAHGVVDPVTAIAGRGRRARGPLPRRRLHRRLGAAVRRPARPRRCRRGRSPSTGSRSISRRPAQVRLRPEGHLAAAAPHAGAAPAAVLRERGAGPATRCSTRRCSRPSRAARSPARGRWCSTIGDDGYLALAEQGARRRRPAAWRASREIAGAAGRRRARLDAGRPGHRRVLRRVHDHRRDDRGAGWYVQPQLSFDGHGRRRIHLSLSAGDRRARRGVPRGARAPPWPRPSAAGPVAVDPGVVEFVERARPGRARRRRLRRPARRRRAGGSATAGSALPEPDGGGQRHARPRLARRCARRCSRRSSTGSSAPRPRV